MIQVGHADSKMTLDVYAQLEQRIPRHHGENLDKLLSGGSLTDSRGPAESAAEAAAYDLSRVPK